jgi:hypothetical protein
MQDMNNNGVVKMMFWQQYNKAQVHAEFPGQLVQHRDIRRILHNDGLYSYHLQGVQHLLSGDHTNPLQFFE